MFTQQKAHQEPVPFIPLPSDLLVAPGARAQVEKMARQFGVVEDVAYTCETAGHFWLLHVLSRYVATGLLSVRTLTH